MRQPARHFQELIVWQKAHQFVLAAHRMTNAFPKSEIYGLTSQLRRAAVSIPANIAEGFTKTGKADKTRFLNIAQASLEESRYYLLLAQDLEYSDCSRIIEQIEEVSKLLGSYCRTIQKSNR